MRESNQNNQKVQKLTTLNSATNKFLGKWKKKNLRVCKIQPKIDERNFEVTNTDSRPRKTVRQFDVPPDSLFQQEHQINYDREKKSAVIRNLARSSQLCSPLSSTSNNFFKIISLCYQLLKNEPSYSTKTIYNKNMEEKKK